jgi:hypothetical protein
VRPGLRLRQAVNLANLSTLAGLGAAAAGRARIAPSVDGLVVGTRYRLPVPAAPAFCLGNVILTRDDDIVVGSPVFRHEARHATQYAWCGGVVMVPLYLVAAGLSWALTGDFGARNVFERLAGLADGGYSEKQLRPWFRSGFLAGLRAGFRSGLVGVSGSGRTAAAGGRRPRGPASGARAGSSASPFR